jgi:hypothetical protein
VDEALALEQGQGAVYGMFRPARSTDDLTGVQFLPRRAREQRQDRGGRATPREKRHGPLLAHVANIDTIVSLLATGVVNGLRSG